MRSWGILLQIYGLWAQSVVSPVAYLPPESLRVGYRVIAELSRGWQGPVIPFWMESEWELLRLVDFPSGAVLYIEGQVGLVSVFQGERLLARTKQATAWIPLIGQGRAEVRIKGEKGGIGGGVYLVARSDTLAWPTEPLPTYTFPACDSICASIPTDQVFCVESLLAKPFLCWAFPFPPPARVTAALQSKGYRGCIASISISESRVRPLSLSEFVLLMVALAGGSWLIPILRVILWRGLMQPLPVNPLETLGALLLLSMMTALLLQDNVIGGPLCLAGTMIVEGLYFYFRDRPMRWVWQSWFPFVCLWVCMRFLWPEAFEASVALSWLLRAVRLALYLPHFAYLCAAEYFVFLFVFDT
ncbi:MAG: hypothetical protein N2170_00255 [Bacteroidia bacterium]|nr:hypothetical protein [Bacteroidia bacterium]